MQSFRPTFQPEFKVPFNIMSVYKLELSGTLAQTIGSDNYGGHLCCSLVSAGGERLELMIDQLTEMTEGFYARDAIRSNTRESGINRTEVKRQ